VALGRMQKWGKEREGKLIYWQNKKSFRKTKNFKA
jgi:hypothetical protein